MGKGRVLVEKQVGEGRGRFGCQGPFFGACVNDCAVSDGFLLSLFKERRREITQKTQYGVQHTAKV